MPWEEGETSNFKISKFRKASNLKIQGGWTGGVRAGFYLRECNLAKWEAEEFSHGWNTDIHGWEWTKGREDGEGGGVPEWR